jgi:hypothetical protein
MNQSQTIARRPLWPKLLLVMGISLIALGAIMGLHRPLLTALGFDMRSVDEKRMAQMREITTLDWADLQPQLSNGKDFRLSDGELPRGVITHDQLSQSSAEAQGTMSGLARALGGISNLESTPRRMADAFGGLGNMKALQPRSSEVREELNGKTIRIAGFIAPLAFEKGRISEFLLVPYVGACIHVPPPPANQIIHVADLGDYRPDQGLLYPVWVTGKVTIGQRDTDLAAVSYAISGGVIERYTAEAK